MTSAWKLVAVWPEVSPKRRKGWRGTGGRRNAEAERKLKQTIRGEWVEVCEQKRSQTKQKPEQKPSQTEGVKCFSISASACGASEELHIKEGTDFGIRDNFPSCGALRLDGEEAKCLLETADGKAHGHITLVVLDDDRLESRFQTMDKDDWGFVTVAFRKGSEAFQKAQEEVKHEAG